MSVNSSFADSPLLPSNSSLPPLDCFILRKSILILSAFCITNILLILPLSILILYLGYQRWRQQCSTAAAAAAMNHSDIFTYHMAAMEVITVLGCVFYCVGVSTNLLNLMSDGFYMFFSTWCVKIHFHTLTCVERYLAVVHPVAYLGLKNTGAIRIRNISIGCVWLLCFVWWMLVSQTPFIVRIIIYFCLASVALIVVCFCCISVLCALRRPGPGEVGRDGQQTHQMKRRAFNTVVTIMGVLWLCLGGMLVCNALMESHMLSDSVGCAVRASAIWFSLPSGFVLPLLYLQRTGTRPGCKHSK